MKIYALSDQHGKLNFELPEADLILHAGDICPDFAPNSSWGSLMQERWLKDKWAPWCAGKKVMATLGNHDFLSINVIPGLYQDELWTEVGEKDLSIWFSPWSNTFGGWAWMAPPEHLKIIYDEIPEGTDIIVSHQPPYGYGDQVPESYRTS